MEKIRDWWWVLVENIDAELKYLWRHCYLEPLLVFAVALAIFMCGMACGAILRGMLLK